MKSSYAQMIKRQAKKAAGLTFTDRCKEAVRTGTKVADVLFKREGKQILAIAKK